MSSIFDGYCIAFSGVFDAGNHNKLQTIVKEHGAASTSALTKKTTHLVASKEDYEKESTKVKSARARAEEVSIVTWQWVEDSISQKCKQDESNYSPAAGTNDDNVDMVDTSGLDKDDEQTSKTEVSRKRKRTVKVEEADVTDGNSSTTTIVASSSSTVVSTKKKRKTKGGSSSTSDQTDGVDVEIVEEKKMVTIIKKGRAPVDSLFSKKDNTHVYCDDMTVWDCLLNQTNVSGNNNKFFVIQLLEYDSLSGYFVFTRWGRVGYDGQSTTAGPFGLDMAKREFEKKFRDKTRNSWSDVCQDISRFVAHKGKYTLLERDYGEDDEGIKDEVDKVSKGKGKAEDTEPPKVPESTLHPKVQDIIKTIFDISAFKNTMVELNYDATKLPLGKLSKNTITQGYQVLKRIEAVLNGNESGDIEDLTNEFYTVIPHHFGMRKPTLINSEMILKQKLEMVEALGEIEIATSIIKSSDESLNKLDSHYNSLHLDKMVPLDHKSEEFKLLVKYVKNTQGATHNNYTLEILDAFDIERQGERSRYEKYSKLHNRMLLWHGSRKTNFAGILSQGLRIAPPHVPCTGYMFGKGVYFADCVTKSANYCYPNYNDNFGFMLLCEVACGDMLELVHGDYNAGDMVKRQGKHCTKGMGRTVPDPKGFVKLENGTVVPCGTGKCINNDKSLIYNEYIVYDVSQIFQKYLLKVEFKFNSRW